MTALHRISAGMMLLVVTWFATTAAAQQVHVNAPLVGVSDSFYERFGTNWGFRTSGPNGFMFFDSGGAAGGIPPFGGYDPSADARFGFGVRGNNGSAYFNLVAGQGSTRSIVSQSGSLTLMNGYPGFVQDISVRPFVTGLVPVVGDYRVNPLEEKIARLREQASTNRQPSTPAAADMVARGDGEQTAAAPAAANNSYSSAQRGDVSVAEIRRQQEAARQQPDLELQELMETARLAEARGFYGAARIRYQKAAARADGALKQELLDKLEALRGK